MGWEVALSPHRGQPVTVFPLGEGQPSCRSSPALSHTMDFKGRMGCHCLHPINFSSRALKEVWALCDFLQEGDAR